MDRGEIFTNGDEERSNHSVEQYGFDSYEDYKWQLGQFIETVTRVVSDSLKARAEQYGISGTECNDLTELL